MAFTADSGAYLTWFKANRPGSAVGGTTGFATGADLAVGDYLVGYRSTVTATGSTTSGVRTVTLRKDVTGLIYSVGILAASSLAVIRP